MGHNYLESIKKIHAEGNPKEVFGQLKRRLENLNNGLEDKTRPVLFILGGVLRGGFGGGGLLL